MPLSKEIVACRLWRSLPFFSFVMPFQNCEGVENPLAIFMSSKLWTFCQIRLVLLFHSYQLLLSAFGHAPNALVFCGMFCCQHEHILQWLSIFDTKPSFIHWVKQCLYLVFVIWLSTVTKLQRAASLLIERANNISFKTNRTFVQIMIWNRFVLAEELPCGYCGVHRCG